MTTFLWVLIVLALAVGIAVVAWTQAAIWRRLDRIEARVELHGDALVAQDDRTTQLRAGTIAALSARTDLTEGGVHPSAFFARKDHISVMNQKLETLREATEALTRKDQS